MRYRLIVLLMLLCLTIPATAQVSVSIGINVPVYPELVPVPGYPVYYAPRLGANYFFYDGMYWVYDGDNWHSSFWYNGPWSIVMPVAVPVFVLRIPVQYYRVPPPFFHGWRRDGPPHWGERWGREWEQRRSGWDRWDRRSAPSPAPLPAYQRNYSGDRYPHAEQQHALVSQNYRYQPRDPVVREHYQQLRTQAAPAPAEKSRQPAESQQRTPRQQERSAPPPSPPKERSVAPAPPPPQQRSQEIQRSRPPQQERERVERPVPAPAPRAGPPVQHEPQGKGGPPEAKGPPPKGEAKGEAKGQEHNK